MAQDDRIEVSENAEHAERERTEKSERIDAIFCGFAEEALLADYRLPNPFFFGIGG